MLEVEKSLRLNSSRAYSKITPKYLVWRLWEKAVFFCEARSFDRNTLGRTGVWTETIKTRSILNIEKLEAKQLLGCIYFYVCNTK